ncbi:unnamed protein product [Allacma fusca]|uniref:Uncharacterized protein n=1 Tax=Allacma fusca TaxID=39272 RepID=A0A8J2PCZ8_9HEXA|nr:unnamed protein product [Allacma fusca]
MCYQFHQFLTLRQCACDKMCFFCCYFCCPDDHDVFESEQRAYRQSKCNPPRNADKKVITFVEQVRTKGVTAYERCAQQYQRRCHPKTPLLRDQFGKPVCASKKYLTCSRRSLSLSDVSERSEESVSESLGSSLEFNADNNHPSTYSHSDSFTCSINGDDMNNQKRPNSTDARKSIPIQ